MPAVRAIALGTFVVGLVVGIAVGVAMVPTGPSPVDPENPQYSIASGTGCIDETGGWYVTTSADRDRLLVVNVTVAHPPDEAVSTRFFYAGDGRYQFVLTTTNDGKVGTPDCRTGTTTELGATIPRDFESVTVVYDGDVLTTVERPADTGPTLRRFNVSA